MGTAGNGAMKASAPEAKTVLGRLPTLRRKRGVEQKALARKKRMPVRGDKKEESAAGQGQRRNPRNEQRDNV